MRLRIPKCVVTRCFYKSKMLCQASNTHIQNKNIINQKIKPFQFCTKTNITQAYLSIPLISFPRGSIQIYDTIVKSTKECKQLAICPITCLLSKNNETKENLQITKHALKYYHTIPLRYFENGSLLLKVHTIRCIKKQVCNILNDMKVYEPYVLTTQNITLINTLELSIFHKSNTMIVLHHLFQGRFLKKWCKFEK